MIGKKSILIRGPIFSSSKYGAISRFVLNTLRDKEEFDIYALNVNFEQSDWTLKESEESRWMDNVVFQTMQYNQQMGGQIKFDVSLQIGPPPTWARLADINIGYTYGSETDSSPAGWNEVIQAVDMVITTSTVAKESIDKLNPAFESKTVVVNYPVLYYDMKKFNIDLKSKFNFLFDDVLCNRANIQSIISSFLKEFALNDDVGLVLFSRIANASNIDRERTILSLNNLINSSKRGSEKCHIYLIHGDLPDSERTSLYNNSQIKSIISMSHGDMNSISLLRAAQSGLPIIAPNWAAIKDYIPDDGGKYISEIEWGFGEVEDNQLIPNMIEKGQKWCYPSEYSFRKEMRSVFENYDDVLSMAKELKSHVKKDFKKQSCFDKLIENINLACGNDFDDPMDGIKVIFDEGE